jgi:PTH1 family peptidyl-tRNA hydrolase
VDAIADAIPILIAGDEGAFMSRVALLVFPPPPKPPRPEDEPPPRDGEG